MGYVLIVLYSLLCIADLGKLIPMFTIPAIIFLIIWVLKYRNHAPQLYTFRIISLVFAVLAVIMALGSLSQHHGVTPEMIGYAVYFVYHLVCYLVSNKQYKKLMGVKL